MTETTTRYSTLSSATTPKYHAGKAARPISCTAGPSASKADATSMMPTIIASKRRGRSAPRTHRVRKTKSTSDSVHAHSSSQPAWNMAIKAALPAASNAIKDAPHTAGHTPKNKMAKVMMSKAELAKPKWSIKPPRPLPDHALGRAISSPSTLSHDNARQVAS